MWYIAIDGKTEGPYSFLELRKDLRLTRDTFVWREGFDKWKRIRDVPELASLFDGEDESKKDTPELKTTKPVDDEIVLDTRMQPPYFIWSLVALLILLYLFYQMLWSQ